MAHRRAKAEQAQGELNWRQHGGRRAGAGRKKKPGRRKVAHARRPRVSRHKPMLVTMRLVDGVVALRQWKVWRALRRVFVAGCRRPGFRLCHFTVQDNHLHAIVEADDNQALSRAMAALQHRITRVLNALMGGRKGTVFADRYHLEVLSSPRQVRNSIAYTLLNSRRHRVDEWERCLPDYRDDGWVDDFSSCSSFDGWVEHQPCGPPPDEPVVAAPESWLLREGWRRHGLISSHDIPGPKR